MTSEKRRRWYERPLAYDSRCSDILALEIVLLTDRHVPPLEHEDVIGLIVLRQVWRILRYVGSRGETRLDARARQTAETLALDMVQRALDGLARKQGLAPIFTAHIREMIEWWQGWAAKEASPAAEAEDASNSRDERTTLLPRLVAQTMDSALASPDALIGDVRAGLQLAARSRDATLWDEEKSDEGVVGEYYLLSDLSSREGLHYMGSDGVVRISKRTVRDQQRFRRRTEASLDGLEREANKDAERSEADDGLPAKKSNVNLSREAADIGIRAAEMEEIRSRMMDDLVRTEVEDALDEAVLRNLLETKRQVSAETLAKQLGKPASTVKHRRARLRKAIERHPQRPLLERLI